MSFFNKLFGKKGDSQKPVVARNMFNLQMNDIITYDFEDYTIVGKINYDDHGFKWHAYQLEGVSKTIWLSVEMDDELYLGIYEKVKLKLSEPLSKKIEYNGIIYTLEEKGKAMIHGIGRSQNVNGMTCEYYDYCDEEEEKFLSVEKWGSEIEVSTGYEIEEYELKIIASN
ncbi:DUF4178 domain-containing protein [Metabacillus fastidiosus]|uniref:DUF4178 domain-containing protein n=1 Tax=Metabacillus fastidiosus TaxID=1458 RepID=A0ABU6NTH6_9BACI|nr:DUF4178 domain-containing protein [Metabacillus fastidiosus]MED4400446.1 DUF4178 domain-containing protein [Metabacillus fastidiosus]MED4464330.1 DUF4178 domain-containing protein [Metabacillus fastidiosus]MED4531070.1 DUF4178 domain-containing protein [Metabacillus fastidiosus]